MTVTATGSTTSGGKYNRKASTRRDVRMRDMKCRVTGDIAGRRQRGFNFVGLEVAHMFPLGGIDLFPVSFPRRDPRLSVFYKETKIPSKPSKENLDIPLNAIVLRSDVHRLFDDYQFGIDGHLC
ncbi:uncharacterized protein BT62DRAFT_933625 [Guyanagaster necrorhizus]|uniref:HNH nuclease domain-containing protein n=1 Tax=Guyanagaster necrorhizus TaxID=856835 RepID=A0A9P7VRF2_9AGAR|nr:uncharacterized protein BT62DRAFT_933625 [Guyanagaster necrorhizus MCA 3950]KAG7444596.1 hypothetical protein BT62DRAFT_933625 [Guyanagaster necrorhizus MCA 3950]